MSMQVYNAYRIRDPYKLWALVWKIRDTAQAKAIELLRAHYAKLVREMDTDDPAYKKARKKEDPAYSEAGFRLGRARELIRAAYKANVTSMHWDTYTLDVCFCVYPYDGQFYLRTFCQAGSILADVFDFVPEMPELEDFHYQNSTDRPKKVSERQWKNRRRVWDSISKAYNDIGNHVTVDVVSWHGFYRIDPWLKLVKEWQANPPDLPSREEIWALKIGRQESIDDISFKKGLIEANKGTVRVFKKGRKWISSIKGVEKVHKTLNHAADHVWFEHLPERERELVLRMIENAQARGRK